jgi:LPS-assembly protein
MIIPLMSNPVRLFNPKIEPKKTTVSSVFQPIGLLMLSGLSVQVGAADPSTSRIQQCLPELIAPLQLTPKPFTKKSQPLAVDLSTSSKHLEADQLSQPAPNHYLFTGNAKFTQPNLVVLSDRMFFNQGLQQAQFQGHVEVHQPEILLIANQVEMNEQTQTSLLTDAQYQILPSRMHGQASRIQLDQKTEAAQLNHATLTACKQQPNKSLTWQLKFKEVEINQQTEMVEATSASLWVKGVPVLYTPYFAYSLADRASGFLFAEMGTIKSVTQKDHLQFIKIPYFFDLAPNMDNTLTVIPIDKRGVIFDNEFRYLNHTLSLTFDATTLQDQLTEKEGLTTSDAAGNITYGKKISQRWRGTLTATKKWTPYLTGSIKWHEASDENFYADIPVESQFTTVTQIPRNLKLSYQKENLQTYAQVSSYLRLRNAPLNYEKRPEVGLRYRQQMDDFSFNIQSSVTDFVLPISSTTKPEALRFHLKPSVEYQLNQPYGSVKATVVGNQTLYQMRDNEGNNTGASTHSLFVPQFALKGGLIFERPVQFLGQSYTQTLEPEAQYLYVPYQEQANLPLFDTSNRSLAFSNLFSLNRFTGSDRVGDANQFTTALTTRFLNQNGRQVADAGVGQIFYLDDRLVGLTDTPPQTAQTSDVFLKLGLNLGAASFSSTLQFTQQDYNLLHANSRIKYRSAQYGTLLANHVLTNKGTASEKETLSIGGYTQVAQAWQLGSYLNYDLYNKQLYHGNLGIRYDACCWAIEFIAERTQLDNDLYNDAFRVQFELKGLSSSEQAFKKILAKKLNF